MSTAILRADAELCRTRARRTMAASAALHALLFVWLVTHKTDSRSLPAVTEIIMLEPGDLGSTASAKAAAPGSASEPVLGVPIAAPADIRFRREQHNAEIMPEPQSASATQDQLNARLASLRGNSETPIATVAVSSTPIGIWSSPATASTGRLGGGSAPLPLRRGGTGSGPGIELTRHGREAPVPALAAAEIPAEKSAARAPAMGGEPIARRTLAGASLAGPIADRPILSFTPPAYPEWAKREAVEGSVTLYFVVRPDGSVKENVLVQKTAGFEDFDENARVALLAWRFEPLRGGRTGEQWGTITLHFRLRDAE
jgi:TonB family protein